jgi:phenylalanyl-tRNA synthetase beta chain
MIVTWNWLQEFVDISGTPHELADRLTMAGLEVEGLTTLGAELDSVIVARLEQVEPHPDAERLTLCRVNNGQDIVQVVCGATNHKTGDLVALAQPGSVLPGNFKIKKSKIRGLESQGMLCSEKELGLSSESDGIMILDPTAPLGVPVFDVLGLKDSIFEIGLTPNRPDCLSLVGIAREVAALYQQPLRLPQIQIETAGEAITSQAGVEIHDSTGCPRYAARMIRQVKVGPSPAWMVRRLEQLGMRSINNVVDITNYVMMELGHPLHAFDFRELNGRQIVVRRAFEGEAFTTLDGNEHQLCAEDLMICDQQRAVALAGVMGGLNSEVKDDSCTILLEAAWFDPRSIRRTSKRHGLHTESSHRFERGADIDMVPLALNRAAALMAEYAGGEVAPGIIDNYPRPLAQVELCLRVSRVEQLLGVPVSPAQVTTLLASIGLEVRTDRQQPEQKLYVKIPSFRPDLEREVDLIEEVARLFGYDRVPSTMPTATLGNQALHQNMTYERRVRDFMAGSGFSEVINYAFISADAVGRLQLGADDPRLQGVKILNPLNEEMAVMRTTLVPSLLETLARNLAYRTTDLQLFELRPVFFPADNPTLSRQQLSLVAAISGRFAPVSWAQQNRAVDFYDLKGVLEKLLAGFCLPALTFADHDVEPFLHPGKSARFMAGDSLLGSIGELHPLVQQGFELEQTVYLFELNLDALFKVVGPLPGCQAPSRFPAVERDTALLLDAGTPAQQVIELARRNLGRLGQDVTLFDLYTGAGIPEGKKSLALRVRYVSAEKTLTEDEVAKAHNKLIKALCHQLQAEIR